jgi:hypothetical protein
MKKYLQKKIEDAVAERQEPKGYGDNPEELETVTANYIYVTPDELNQIVKSRKCRDITLSTQLGGYDEESLKNDRYYPYAFSVRVDLTKKTAKSIISNFIDIYEDKLVKVYVSSTSYDEGKFRITL